MELAKERDKKVYTFKAKLGNSYSKFSSVEGKKRILHSWYQSIHKHKSQQNYLT